MTENNVILDIDVAVDLLTDRKPHSRTAKAAVEKALTLGCGTWLVATGLPSLLDELTKEFGASIDHQDKGATPQTASSRARNTLKGFLKTVRVLSSYGFDAEAALETETPVGTLILRAADALGDDVVILSRDPALIRADRRVIDPQGFIDRTDSKRGPKDAPLFVDLARQQHRILPQMERGIFTVLRHGQYIMGPEIENLEEQLAAYVGVEHAICCSNGTDALLMALMARSVGPGDAIFTSPFSFISSAEVISLLGATPVFVDIDPKTFNIDPESLERAIVACREYNPGIHSLPSLPTPSARALEPKGIIAVDLFGLPAEFDRLNAIARRHRLFVIEDAAQSFGARYHGKRACSLSDIACTSFFPAKPLGCYGDGGAVFTKDDEMAERLASIRNHGKGKDKYNNIRVGLNARMDTVQAALLLPKLNIFEEELASRNRIANRYTELLAPHESLRVPYVPEGLQSAWAQYSVLADRREEILAALKAKGIPTAVYYPKPLHLQTAFAGLGYQEGDFPESESTASLIFSLPMHPYLQDRHLRMITTEISTVLKK